MPEPIATFRGPVSCVRSDDAPGFTLTGLTTERPGEPTTLVFAAAPPPADLPGTLEDALVERLAADDYRVSAAARAWRIPARTVEVHREVADAFYRALPPRRAPWHKRAVWSAMLALASSRAGLAVLRRLRR